MTNDMPTITVKAGEYFYIKHPPVRIILNRRQAQRVWEVLAPYFDGREVAPVAVVGDLEE